MERLYEDIKKGENDSKHKNVSSLNLITQL